MMRLCPGAINKKAQSLVELASFGAVLLLCLGALIQYGMNANYEQNLQMQTFRKALRAAYYKSGPAATVSLSRTEDKPIPEPREPWGFPDRRPVSASAQATWDSNIQGMYIDDYSETPSDADLPRSIIEINSEINSNRPQPTLGLSDADLSDGAIDRIDSTKGAFVTARYDETGCNGSITVVLENDTNERAGTRQEYRTQTVNCADIKVKNRRTPNEDPGKKYAYIRPGLVDGLQQTVGSADVNGDNEMDFVLAVEGTNPPCNPDGDCGGVLSFKYIDFQRGEINSELTQIMPWETNKFGADIRRQEGLLYDYEVRKNQDNSLVKREDARTLRTTTTIGGDQRVTHTIRTNEGTMERRYTTTFTPAQLDSYTRPGVDK